MAKSVLDGALFAMLGIGFFIHVRKSGVYPLSYNAPFVLSLVCSLFFLSLLPRSNLLVTGGLYFLFVTLLFPLTLLFARAFSRTQQTLFFIASAALPAMAVAIQGILIGIPTNFFAAFTDNGKLLILASAIGLCLLFSAYVSWSRRGVSVRAAMRDIEMFERISFRSMPFVTALDMVGYYFAAAGFFLLAALYGLTIYAQLSILLYQFVIYELMGSDFSPLSALISSIILSLAVSAAVFLVGAQWEYALVGTALAVILLFKKT